MYIITEQTNEVKILGITKSRERVDQITAEYYTDDFVDLKMVDPREDEVKRLFIQLHDRLAIIVVYWKEEE